LSKNCYLGKKGVLIREVSGLQELFFGKERCPHFRGVLREGFKSRM
jgi:hypothetical protein